MIYASLKFDKTFYLLAQFTESRLFSTRSRFMTAKTAPKVTLWEFFQQLGKNLHVTRGIIVVLRHYARHW
ncbi:PTS system maltose- and glucose-specific EIICB component [Escherichia coli TA143]|nr:PTS system maltose- and glucose-specific EIICB component [Escherichia coli TA143]